MGSDVAGGPVVLVTGGVRGLGLASARGLAARGARVHVAWRSSEAAAEALRAEFGGRLHRADLASSAEASTLVEAVLARDGRLDGLVHAVGDYATGPLAELATLDLEHLFASNVFAAWNTLLAARAALRTSRGRVVLFGMAGLDGMGAKRRAAGYAAAKSALVVLARSLALEEAPHGVSVNVVSPGLVPHADAHPETLDPEIWSRLPRGEPTPIDAIADTVAWLLLDAPADLTGANLPVSGGWML